MSKPVVNQHKGVFARLVYKIKNYSISKSIILTIVISLGAIFNNGDKPLFPVDYSLKVIDEGKEIIYLFSPIDTSVLNIIKGKDELVKYNKKITDLTSIIKIDPHEASFGTILFVDTTNTELTQNYSIILKCRDVMGNNYEEKLSKKILKPYNGYYDPRAGLQITR